MNEIINKCECCGCGGCCNACRTNCITMQPDSEGFLYPICEEYRCDYCSRCAIICPVRYPKQRAVTPKVYACFNNNTEERFSSTSGGIFSLLARKIIDENGVVFGATFNKKYEVVHGSAETITDLARLRGTKYSQSRMGNAFEQIQTALRQNRKVLFSGTPCQIAVAKNYLGRDIGNVLLVEIVCHSVPSPGVFKYYVNALQRCYGQTIKSIDFRKKEPSWKNSQVVIEFENKTISESVYQNCFTCGFFNGLYSRPACHHCPSKGEFSASDLTLGDYWGIETAHPNMDSGMGTSLVLLHTSQGEEAFQSIASDMAVQESTLSLVVQRNPFLLHSSVPHEKRNLFFEQFAELNQKTPSLKEFQTLIETLLTR